MQKSSLILLGSLLVLVALAFALMRNDKPKRSAPTSSVDQATSSAGSAKKESANEPLMLYCAASNRAVVEAIIAQYKQECGREVQVQFGPSQTLLTSLEVSGKGDLFLPADSSYVEMAKEKKTGRRSIAARQNARRCGRRQRQSQKHSIVRRLAQAGYQTCSGKP